MAETILQLENIRKELGLSKILLSARPGLKTLFMSGYTADIIAQKQRKTVSSDDLSSIINTSVS